MAPLCGADGATRHPNDVSVIRHKDTSYPSGFVGLRIYGWGDFPCNATYSQLKFK
jgi:hypothetical protein